MIDLIVGSRPLLDALECSDYRYSRKDKEFLDAIEQLMLLSKQNLRVAATQLVDRQRNLKEAYRHHVLLTKNVQEVEEDLTKVRAEISNEISRKKEAVQAATEKYSQLKEHFAHELNELVLKSEKSMMERGQVSEVRQTELSQELRDLQRQYERMLEENMTMERDMRKQLEKVEQQLGGCIAKYDSDMMERQAHLETLQAAYDADKASFDDFQRKLDEQQNEYERLMAEKEAEERRIYDQIAWDFLRLRSARKIQRWWRAYLERKRARRKARKGKAGAKKKGKKK